MLSESYSEIESLLEKYRYNWGKDVDLSIIIPGLTQEKLLIILRYIVETGDSLLVGYNKCFKNRR